MSFPDKPLASAGVEQRGDYWVVVTRNVAGKDRDERPFRGKAEADAFLLQQLALVRAENGS